MISFRWEADVHGTTPTISMASSLPAPTSTVTASIPSRCGRSTTCRSRSEEHTSELQSLMRISYAVFCLKKKTKNMFQTLNNKDVHENPNTMQIQNIIDKQ